MKKLLWITTMVLSLVFYGNAQNTKTQTSTKMTSKDPIEVLYFHGKQRCMTCRAIEKLTKEVLDTDFAEQVKQGKIVFKEVDISKAENEKIANRYYV